jgi:hypothetical protein
MHEAVTQPLADPRYDLREDALILPGRGALASCGVYEGVVTPNGTWRPRAPGWRARAARAWLCRACGLTGSIAAGGCAGCQNVVKGAAAQAGPQVLWLPSRGRRGMRWGRPRRQTRQTRGPPRRPRRRPRRHAACWQPSGSHSVHDAGPHTSAELPASCSEAHTSSSTRKGRLWDYVLVQTQTNAEGQRGPHRARCLRARTQRQRRRLTTRMMSLRRCEPARRCSGTAARRRRQRRAAGWRRASPLPTPLLSALPAATAHSCTGTLASRRIRPSPIYCSGTTSPAKSAVGRYALQRSQASIRATAL